MKKSNELTLKEAIENMLEAYKLNSRVDETRLKSAWSGMMGEMISRHTTNIRLRDGRLTIQLNSSTLRHELQYAREKIAERLNEELGKKVVEEVVIR